MIKTITGLDDIQISAVAGDFLHKKSPALFVVSSLPKAKELALDFSFFMPKKDVFILPDEDPFFLQFEARSSDRVHDRCIAIASMIQARDAIYIAPINAVLKKIMPIGSYSSYVISFTKEKEIDLADVRNKLVVAGYQRVSMVELQGQWALRGDILDIFPVDFDDPVRIDLFDTTVERIRRFDPVTQRSLHGEIDKLSVYPAEQLLIDDASARDAKQGIHDAYTQAMKRGNDLSYELSKKLETLISYIDNRDNYQLLENYIHYFYHKPQTLLDYLVMPLTSNADIFILDPEHINNVLTLRRKESSEDFEALLMKGHAIAEDFQSYPEAETVEQFFEQYEKQWRVAKKNVANIYNISQFSEQKNAINYIVKHPIKMLGNLSILEDELKRYLDSGFETTIVYSAEDKEKSLGEFLSQRGLKGKVKLRQGSLVEGIELTDQKKVYLWEGDIFKTYKRRRRRISSEHTQQIQSFTDIKSGDFVVHETHGIGKYLGVNTLTVQGVTRDFLKIAYAGTDILYVPVDQMSLVQKYIGGGEHLPRVSNLSTDTWKRTKAKVKEDAYKMAEELIELSAKRMSRKGFAFSPDTVWQHDFEEAFPYEETNDQLRAISSIKSDMERPIPMDRLICGDVGYGKTEVAMRGVFKCVSDSKQAAILVPTTILAGQHYETFKKRFKDYPFRVEVISRFKTPEQQKKIIKDLKAGAVDVIIGTHRLISKDIEYHDLGLLVIDEEQRFGVAHKEKIKHMKEDVDVITLSATPIPRTLNMSLVGVRDMDLIEEPPEDRYPVQTYVVPETDDILGETIRREIERDGQVFVVVPRISGIARVAETIKALLPEARVAVGHGRLGPQNLEDIMLDFIDGQIDVLIATTIVESGLDIPRANTMIVIDSDKFGLSQLYQLRGRVGRSNVMAFAYFLHKGGKQLSEVAIKRLKAIREFTEFGAGFKLAMRDLEIRGAGNLLGTEQSGHMAQVGYELYVKMIDDAVRVLKGEVEAAEPIEVKIDLGMSMHIPQTYVDSEVVRLDLYKRISYLDSIEDIEDQLQELEDRFGKPPKEVRALLYVSYMTKLAQKAGISHITRTKGRTVFTYADLSGFSAKSLMKLPDSIGKRLSFSVKSTAELRLSGPSSLKEIDIMLENLIK